MAAKKGSLDKALETFGIYPTLTPQVKLEPLLSSWMAFPETQRPMPHSPIVSTNHLTKELMGHTKQAPIAMIPRLAAVKAIFRQEVPYSFQLRNNQNIPLMPSDQPVSLFLQRHTQWIWSDELQRN